MSLRRVLLLFVLIGGLGLLSPMSTRAKSTPLCHGKKATVVMTSPGELHEDADYAVIVGSSGDDLIVADGAHSLVCAGKGADQLTLNGHGSVGYLGSEDDWARVESGSTVYGEGGDDYVQVFGGTAVGGSGNDTIYINDGGKGVGGSGNDTLYSIYGDVAEGGSGKDRINDYGTSTVVDCGSDKDLYVMYAGTTPLVRRCEIEQP